MKHRQRGMSMVVAIFLIVVVALLAAFAVSVGSDRFLREIEIAAGRESISRTGNNNHIDCGIAVNLVPDRGQFGMHLVPDGI